MRRTSAPAEIAFPITYTPTTHRISKAKKGKRVHACEFPGCNKVFTRAEHRRRHELNHNPEALYRCTNSSCKKAFHRPDLLARHMERHELEAQMNQAPWGTQHQNQTSLVHEPTTSYVPKCAPTDPHSGFLTAAATPNPQNSMSIGSIVGPAIHPDLASDCGLLWNGIDAHPEPQTSLYPPQHHHHHHHHQQPHVHESVEDTRFYATPETCPSPLSDGPTLSIPSHSRSSVCSTPVAVVDSYPDTNVLESELTSSPMTMHASMRCWDQSDNMSNMVPLSLNESLIQPNMHCQYPSATWPGAHHLSYDEHSIPVTTQYPPPTAVAWKAWSP